MNKLLSGRRVLVVEDEMLVMMDTEDMLADLGCESVTATSTIDEALTAINAQTFDAAMLDMNLNGQMSESVADALAGKGVPFMFATGYDAVKVGDSHSNRPVLTKPYEATDLAKMLSRILRPA